MITQEEFAASINEIIKLTKKDYPEMPHQECRKYAYELAQNGLLLNLTNNLEIMNQNIFELNKKIDLILRKIN